MSDLTGQRLGRYQVEQKLGEGGMAVVYRARDLHLERDVALKVIRVDVFPAGGVEQILKRFDREARALGRLTHANIVGVIDYGEHEGAPYLVMEYLPGGSLQQRMGTPMPFSQAAHIVALIAGALDFAHKQGIVHRDVKPSNILLTASGDPMLSDFGIAKLLEVDEGTTALTGSGFMIGTPDYMAPEQWVGRTVPASDQYSLGIILYELVTGRKPYTASTPAELLIKQATEPLPRPREFIRDLPAPAEQTILRALAKEPQERYPDMRAFAWVLDTLAQTQGLGISLSPALAVSAVSAAEAAPAGTPGEGKSARPLTPQPQPPTHPPSGQPQAQPGRAPAPGSHAVSPAPAPSGALYRPPSEPGVRSVTPIPAAPEGKPARLLKHPGLILIGGGLLVIALLVMALVGAFVLAYNWGVFGAARSPTPTPALTQVTLGAATPIRPAESPTVQAAAIAEPAASPTAPANAEATAEAAAAQEMAASIETLRVNLEASPDTLDPQKASTVNDIDHVRLLYEGLTRLDEKLATVPGAAEKWEYNSDATQLTFTLRRDLKYSDGSLLNARRFEYAILRNIDPATSGDYASITDEIQGAPQWRSADPAKTPKAELQKLKDAVGVKALDTAGRPCTGYDQPDCLVLRLSFSRPATYFHTVMSLWVAYPAKEELTTKGGADWWKDAANHVGNGPMQLSELEAGTRALFKPNPTYWRGAARVNLEFHYLADYAQAFQGYKDGEIEIISLNAEELAAAQADPALSKQIMIYPGSCTNSLDFNMYKAPFDDKAAREAFAYAIDREGWVKDVLQGLGYPTLTWIPKGFPGYDAGESRFAYNPSRAKALLQAAGYAITGGQLTRAGKAIPITLTYTDTSTNRTYFEWIANKWKTDLGLSARLNLVSPETYSSIYSDDSSASAVYFYGWCADYPDPQNWLSAYWRSTTYFAQRINYKDDVFDRMVDKADAELDNARRMSLYREAQKQLIGDVPGMMLWNDLYAYLVKPAVKGIIPTTQDAGWPGEIDPLTINIVK